jgi:polyisoprenoid-binding protein YceI
MRIYSVVAFIILLCSSVIAQASVKTTWAIKGRSYVKYTMHHTLHEFSGTDTTPNCIIAYDPVSLAIQKVSASTNVSDFNSGSGNRDSHAMEVLEAIKYPQITFKCNKIEYSGPKLTLYGHLTFHGVSKDVIIQASEQKSAGTLKIKGSFKVSQEEYGIQRETFMMVPVDDPIQLDFEMYFTL